MQVGRVEGDMLKLLFKILQALPKFQALLSEYFAQQNAATEKALADYKLQSLNQAATIEHLQSERDQWRGIAKSNERQLEMAENAIRLRECEIERLKNETAERRKAVESMDSEAVFNASIAGSGNSFPVYDRPPVGKIETGRS